MPITTIDPNAALIVVDLQEIQRSLPHHHDLDTVIENTTKLTTAFRERDLPVVLVNVGGMPEGRTAAPTGDMQFPDNWNELLPELDQQPDDLTVTKTTWGAFHNSDLADRLRTRGVTNVVIAGVATGFGVDSTAREAHSAGFNVTLVTDAMTDHDGDAHEHAVTKIFPMLGETGTTAEVLAQL
ncbi:isochorismatase family cysteine hydrolase [Curtobacterium sp. NPDC089185]|uniref:cysteine hydrolase family protein n=1 Tax=Curtobacterium sp. NPDC089185 TaxID=3154968 RepID=UPI00341DC465